MAKTNAQRTYVVELSGAEMDLVRTALSQVRDLGDYDDRLPAADLLADLSDED